MLRICQIGCGSHARAVYADSLRAYLQTHEGAVDYAACCDLDGAAAASYGQLAGFAAAYSDIDRMLREDIPEGSTTGLEDAAKLFVCYSRLYRVDPKGMRFTLDAELTLHSAGKLHEIKNQPPEPFEASNGPMAKAIRKGLLDGSISPDVDVREIYYNSYDAILGIMQRLSIGGTPSARELDYDSRMLHLSQLFVRALSGK